ncbi:MAG: heme exporter protein CcmD [Burkholderiales bacterium]|jgi:heme exporter protein D
MSEFFAMGGYAWYVWMAYGAAALTIAIEIATVRSRRKRAFDELRMSVAPTPPPPSIIGARSSR